MRDETRVAREARAGPLPDLAERRPPGSDPWVQVAARSTPPLSEDARRARGRRRRPRTRTRGRRAPAGRIRHARMVRDVELLLPRPALVGPPLAAHVAAALAEVHPALVADREVRDLEGAERDARGGDARCRRRRRRRPRPSESARRRSGPAWMLPRILPRRLAGQAAAPRSRASGASSRSAGARGAAPSRTPRRRRRPRARAARACARARPACTPGLGGPERVHLRAHRARRLEGVIDARQVGPQQLPATEPVGHPEVLVGGDVAKVPRERAHDRGVHARELLLAAA